MIKIYLKAVILFTLIPLSSACGTTATPTPSGNILQTVTPLPTSTVPVNATDVPTGGTITPGNTARSEMAHILQGHEKQIVAFAFSSDDRELTSLSSDFTLKRWDVNSGEESFSLKLQGSPIYNGAISPLGNVFAVEGPGHVIQLRDLQDGKVLREMTGHSAFVMSLAFSSDGRWLATADDNGLIKVWEVETGSLVHFITGHSSSVGALAFSPDSSLLASGGVEGSTDIRIWDMSSGKEIMSLEKHTGNVYDLAFSPDGTLLASSSGDFTVKLWDVATGKELNTFRGHRSNIYSVDFSPDGKLLASGDFAGNIKLWDIAGGRELENLKSHTDLVKPVRFSNNGCLLASGSFDSTIILWDIPSGICSSDQTTNLLIAAPNGNPPTLDGTMSTEEWSDAKLELFSDGSELFMKHHEGYLYLGIRASTPGMIVGNIFVDRGDRVSILHSSAALGTAIYEKRPDGWEQTQDFVWRCRDSSTSPSAQAARETFFQEEGWLANISYMGIPQELEYKIAMPDGSLRLAVTVTPASDVGVRIYWPLGLTDDCIVAPQREFPTTMQFDPSMWATVMADNPETTVRSLDQMAMVLVPGGTFQMGSTETEVKEAIAFCKQHYSICNDWFYMRENPQHPVTVSDFWLDQTEVTNAQYHQCVEAGVCPEPVHCKKGEPTYQDAEKADHPVVCVSWDEAQTYCEWTGTKLPTEAEWEYAFRGEQNLIYPWGNTFDGSKLNYCDGNCEQSHADDKYDDGFVKTAPVGTYPKDVSWCGVQDMSGNASEWVADWSAGYSSAAELNPTGPLSGNEKILRGCSWYAQPAYCRGAARPFVSPDTRFDYLGFRCASSVLP